MKPYLELTVNGQARRLRRLVQNALANYDLPVTRVRLVTNDMNGIFRLDTADGMKYILRVSSPEGGHTRDHVSAEMDWLKALSLETDLSVPQPVADRHGDLVVEATAPEVPEPRFCAIFSWVPGRDLAEVSNEENFARLGELSARLHAHALSYTPPRGLKLLKYDRIDPFFERLVLFEPEFEHLYSPGGRQVFLCAAERIQAALNQLETCGEPMRIIHGDLHPWNVRISRGVLSPIDFEDLMLGWPVQDIATTLYYFLREDYEKLRSAFQAGYTRRSPWPERQSGEVDTFIAARGLGLANLVLTDPSLKNRFPPPAFLERVEKRLRKLVG